MKKELFNKKKIFIENYFKKDRGFTLLEMLISISLFTVVTSIAFTALFSVIDANNKAKTINTVVNNLSTVMESMTREIRVGTDYTCGSEYISGGFNCSNGGGDISFLSESGKKIYYSFNSVSKNIERRIDVGSTVNLVGTDVDIDELVFYVFGTGPPEGGIFSQPRVLIILKGTIKRQGENIKTVFKLQTTVSQRSPAK